MSNARVYVGYAKLTSPINGIVVSKQTDVGYLATPGAPLLTIEDNSRYQLEVAVEESRLGTIHLHDQAQLQIEALGNTELIGSVEEIVPASDPNSRSYIVKVGVTKPVRACSCGPVFTVKRDSFPANARRWRFPKRRLVSADSLRAYLLWTNQGLRASV